MHHLGALFGCSALNPDVTATSAAAGPPASSSPTPHDVWSVVAGGLAVVFGSLVLAFVARILNSRRKELPK